MLSHEPIYGLEDFCLNIHGHSHDGYMVGYSEKLDHLTHINLASNVCQYIPINLGKYIKTGWLSNIPNYHRLTIQNATERKELKNEGNNF